LFFRRDELSFRVCYYTALTFGAKLQGRKRLARKYYELARFHIGPCFTMPCEHLVSALMIMTILTRVLLADIKQSILYASLAARMVDLCDVSPNTRICAMTMHSILNPSSFVQWPSVDCPVEMTPEVRISALWSFIHGQIMHGLSLVRSRSDAERFEGFMNECLTLQRVHGIGQNMAMGTFAMAFKSFLQLRLGNASAACVYARECIRLVLADEYSRFFVPMLFTVRKCVAILAEFGTPEDAKSLIPKTTDLFGRAAQLLSPNKMRPPPGTKNLVKTAMANLMSISTGRAVDSARAQLDDPVADASALRSEVVAMSACSLPPHSQDSDQDDEDAAPPSKDESIHRMMHRNVFDQPVIIRDGTMAIPHDASILSLMDEIQQRRLTGKFVMSNIPSTHRIAIAAERARDRLLGPEDEDNDEDDDEDGVHHPVVPLDHDASQPCSGIKEDDGVHHQVLPPDHDASQPCQDDDDHDEDDDDEDNDVQDEQGPRPPKRPREDPMLQGENGLPTMPLSIQAKLAFLGAEGLSDPSMAFMRARIRAFMESGTRSTTQEPAVAVSAVQRSVEEAQADADEFRKLIQLANEAPPATAAPRSQIPFTPSLGLGDGHTLSRVPFVSEEEYRRLETWHHGRFRSHAPPGPPVSSASEATRALDALAATAAREHEAVSARAFQPVHHHTDDLPSSPQQRQRGTSMDGSVSVSGLSHYRGLSTTPPSAWQDLSMTPEGLKASNSSSSQFSTRASANSLGVDDALDTDLPPDLPPLTRFASDSMAQPLAKMPRLLSGTSTGDFLSEILGGDPSFFEPPLPSSKIQ
jgi:hypothetical protein